VTINADDVDLVRETKRERERDPLFIFVIDKIADIPCRK